MKFKYFLNLDSSAVSCFFSLFLSSFKSTPNFIYIAHYHKSQICLKYDRHSFPENIVPWKFLLLVSIGIVKRILSVQTDSFPCVKKMSLFFQEKWFLFCGMEIIVWTLWPFFHLLTLYEQMDKGWTWVWEVRSSTATNKLKYWGLSTGIC